MTEGITGKEPDPREVYAEIIDLSHWQSPSRPHISLHDRAAQFSPFAALSGYDEMIAEEAREVGGRAELDEDSADALNRVLLRIESRIDTGGKPEASITSFVPDPLKDGERYETLTGLVKRIDRAGHRVILEKKAGISDTNSAIDIEDILDIHEI